MALSWPEADLPWAGLRAGGVERPARTRVEAEERPRVLMTTEGTYPYAMGGVSSWCDTVIGGLTEFDWHVLPIVAPHRRRPLYRLPPHAREAMRIEVWGEELPRGRRRLARRTDRELPATLARGLLSWEGDTRAVIDAWVSCRANPSGVRRAFRSPAGWEGFLSALRETLEERVPEAGAPPTLDLLEAATLYQSLYWVARTAAAPAPETDVMLVTAAGWSAIPALVHKALYGTPMVLTEHGVYVRESYLAAARGADSPGARFSATRLARGLTRIAYEGADVIAPVSDANAYWEMGLGIDPAKILVLYNGLERPPSPEPPPGTRTVVVIGRIDPLKDIHTTLRVAAETLELVPDALFLHYGAATDGEDAYERSCRSLHRRLGLGDRFRFMGRTTDPLGVVRNADVFLMTSISEGLPMSILEAMAQARPVVSTGVGGVPEVVKGCGVVTPPGDEHGLAMAVATLLRNPGLAGELGRRGHRRLERVFDEAACIDGYRDLLGALTARGAAA